MTVRHFVRVRYRLDAYQQACLHLGIPLPDSDEAEWHGHGDDEGFLEGEGEDKEYYDDDESPIVGYGLEEGGSDTDGTSNSNDMVYMINKVMVLAVAIMVYMIAPSSISETQKSKKGRWHIIVTE
ncbi:hypothetical protein D1007_08470 [Hordeum vulgare]|nr:hypothetical protein D1007_08470 [Hordeum vulgare]